MTRKIIHVDMDAFFASIEQRDNPDLRNKPVAVGGSEARGVVAAASYEARKFGVFSAMPSLTAKKKCPELLFVKPRFDVYRQVSEQIRDIFHEYTDLVEPLSLDEAYLDVTQNKKGLPSATLIAREIKQRIFEKTALKASAGVSINKFLAKIASDQDKPDGLYVITPDKAEAFVDTLPIEKFHGIGKVTAAKMHELGIIKGSDLKKLEEAALVRYFGKTGHYYYQIARAKDDRDVNPHRVRKSIGAERTFETDISDDESLENEVIRIAAILQERIRKSGKSGRTVTLKVKYADFEQITRSHTVADPISGAEDIRKAGLSLLHSILPINKGIRLLGLTLSSLVSKEDPVNRQLTLDF